MDVAGAGVCGEEFGFGFEQGDIARCGGFFKNVFEQVVGQEPRGGEQDDFERVERQVFLDRGKDLLVELVDGLIVGAARDPAAFPGERDVDALAEDRHVFRHQADIGEAVLHDDGADLRLLGGVAGVLDDLARDGVPPGVCLGDGEVAVELEVEGVVGAELDVFVFDGDAAVEVERGGGRVKVDGGDGGGEGRVDPVRAGAAGGGLGADFADGGGGEGVPDADEVVGVPLGGGVSMVGYGGVWRGMEGDRVPCLRALLGRG